MKYLLPLLLIALVTALNADPFPAEVTVERIRGEKQRNVVFILSDDHRYDAMSFLDHPLAVTPSMDRMAEQGVYLKNACVTTSLCSPSRASILTGLYTFRHRVIDNNRNVPEGTIFFPQYLQKAGYKTAYIGKWHMGHYNDDPRPGFDHWVSFRGQGVYLPEDNYPLNVNGVHVKQKSYITDELTDYAVEWLDEQEDSDQPFFLYLSHKGVHANFTPAQRHEGLLTDVPYERPATETETTENNRLKPRWVRDQRNSWHGVDFPYHSDLNVELYYKRYNEALMSVDDSIGRVLDKLEDMGVLDETLVIYMGDNGFMFGEHGLIDKRVAYDASIRVPMLMHCPDLFDGGTVVEEVVANIDIAPTVFQAAGLRPKDYFDGQSFISLAQGAESDWRENFLYCYYWEKNFPQSPTVFALRGPRYKFISYYGLWDTDELYDLQNDPHERVNLANHPDYSELANQMEDELYTMMGELGGLNIPLNPPTGGTRNLRINYRGGHEAADFPDALIVDEPPNRNAH